MESSWPLKLAGFVQEGSNGLMCVKEGDNYKTWCVWKPDEQLEREFCWEEAWSSSITENSGHETPS